MDSGVQYVMTFGTKQMQTLSVDSLDIHQGVSIGLIMLLEHNSFLNPQYY